jgi:hypothetical protein
MLGIVFIGVVTALAVFTIWAKICAGKPRRAEKWEKGEIIKQLLALSEGENRSPCSVSTSATCSNTSRKDASGSSSQPPISPRPNQADGHIEEKIRQRAYELYQERGGVNGNPTDDWLQAKQEVLSRKARAGSESS